MKQLESLTYLVIFMGLIIIGSHMIIDMIKEDQKLVKFMINKIIKFVKNLFTKKKEKKVSYSITNMLQTFERRNKIAKLYGKKSPAYPIPYRKTFVIPVGKMDKNKAQKEISKLISSYKEDIFKK